MCRNNTIAIVAMMVTLWSGVTAQTLTVADGTATDCYIPVYGLYMDMTQKSQTLYPDTLLTEMTGNYITELTYYFSTAPTAAWGGTQIVRIGTTAANNLGNGFVTSPSTVVWTGTLSANISNNQMHIVLDQSFLYNGGNLLIEMENPTTAAIKYAYFLGQSQTSQMSYIIWDNYGDSYGANFLPKLTFTYSTTPTCPVPNNLAVSINGISATFTWSSSPDSVTNYTFGYKSSTDTSYTDITVTDTFLTINDLYRNKTYQWRVRANCGEGESTYWRNGQSFYIPADTAHVPYNCDFEDPAEYSQWIFRNGNGPNMWYIDQAVSATGSHSMYVSNDNGVSNAYTASYTKIWAYRDIDFDTIYSGHRLSFSGRNHNYYNNMNHGLMKVFIGPPVTPAYSSTPPAGSVQLGGDIYNQSSWKTYSFLLDSTYRGVFRLYYYWENTNSHLCNPPAAIDDITIESFTCAMPEQLTTTEIDSGSAVLTWHTPIFGTASYYTLAYRNLADSDFTTVTLTDTTFTLTGLDTYAPYEWKVRTHCSAIDQSDWSETKQFYTEPPIAGLPYICDFEDSLENHYWRMVNTEDDGWFIGTATAQSGSHSLYVSNDGGLSHAVNQATNGSNVHEFWAYRDVNFTPGFADYQISLDYKGIENAWSNLELFIGNVGVSVPTTATYTPAGTLFSQYISAQDSDWHHLSLTIDSTYQGVKRIYFHFSNSYGPCDPPAAIDNLTIVGNTCPRVYDLQNITVQDTFALLAWESVGAASYTVAYKSIDDTAFTEVQANDTVLRIGGLNSTTSYVWRVRSHCSDSTESYWSGFLTFTTQLPIAFLPYLCDFEDSVENASWQLFPNYSGSNITFIGNAVACGEGNSLYISKDNGVTNSYTPNWNNPQAYRDIYFTPGYPKYLISFDCKGGGDETGVMQISLDDTLLNNDLSNAGFWTRQSIIVDSSFSGYHQLRLQFEYHTTWNPAGAFDNISIKGIFHEPPVDLTTADITYHTAQMSWTPDSLESPISYRLAWRAQSDTTYTEVLLSASDTTFLLSDLETSSWYVWKVKVLCADNEWSEWSSEKAFKTLAQLPYFCDFENEIENQHWTIRIGDYYYESTGSYFSDHDNRWFIGTPSDVADNNKMLFISSNNGVTNSYNYSSPTYVWTYRDIYFDPGYPEYYLSLDFKGMGQEGYDYVRLFLDTPSYPPLKSNLPVPLAQIGEDLNLTNQWTHKHFTIDSTHAGAQRLYILWTNNYGTGTNPPAAIDNISISFDATMCELPESLTAYPEDTIVTLTWSSGSIGNASSYTVAYKKLSDSIYTELTTQDTFLTIQGLTPTTDYQWIIRTICDNDTQSIWSPLNTFGTLDELPAFPYVCDFEDVVENGFWRFVGDNYVNHWVIDTDAQQNGAYSLYVSNDSIGHNVYSRYSASSVWAYRDIKLPEGYEHYQISFDFKGMGNVNYDFMQFYIGPPTMPQGESTPFGATPIGGKFVNCNSWSRHCFDIDSSYAGIQRLYFKWKNVKSLGSGAWVYFTQETNPPAAIDNLSIVGSHCLLPQNITSSMVSGNAQTLSWTCDASSYIVAYRPQDVQEYQEIMVTDTFCNLNTLTPFTKYVWKVRSSCGEDGQSEWSSEQSFETPAQTPYFCDFEDSTENAAWRFKTSTTSTVNMNWHIGNTISGDNEHALYVNDSNPLSHVYWAYRDIFFDPTYNGYDLSFDFNGLSNVQNNNYVRVFIGSPTVPGGTTVSGATEIATLYQDSCIWETKNMLIDSTHKGLQRLYFQYYDFNTSLDYPAYIDNISITGFYCATTCSNLTSVPHDTVADLSWNVSDTDVYAYTLAYKELSDSTFTEILVFEPSFPLSDLSPQTTYIWKVKVNCTDEEEGHWSEESMFTTTVIIPKLPYICDFEDTVENSRWTLVNGNYTNKWHIGHAVNNGGDSSLYISNDNGVTNAYSVNSTSHVWAYRDFYFTPGHSEYHISFDIRSFGELYYNYPYDRVTVFLGATVTPPTSQDSPQGATQLGSEFVNDSVWHTVTFTVDSTYAGIQRLFFLWKNDYVEGTNPPGAVDNIQISTSSCPIPMQLATVNIIDDAATLTWQSDADSFIVAFKSLIDSSFTEILTTDRFYQMSNLEPSSFYIWKVKSLCSDGETSFWSNQVTYQTHSILGRIPYAHGFEDAEENSHWTTLPNYGNTNWFIGHAAYQSGNSAIYISNDNGVSNAYTNTDVSYCWAYRDFYFDPDYSGYEISFDYRVQGAADYAGMKVFVGPPATPVDYATPTGAVQLGGSFYGHPTWTHFTFTADTTFKGVKRLYFLWSHDWGVGSNPPAAVDNVSIQGCHCGVPAHITVDSVTAHTITVHFTPSSPLDNVWEAAVVPHGSPVNPLQLITISNTVYTFQNLVNNTTYDIYIRAVCGSDASYWTQPLTVRTDCGYISVLPYSDNFDTYGSETFPWCWHRLNTVSGNYPYIDLYTPGHYNLTYSTPGMMVFSAPSGTYNIAVLPEIDHAIPVNELQLTFQYKANDPADKFIVGVMIDPEDAATFVPVDTVQLEYHEVQHWAEKKVHLHNYAGNGHFVALRHEAPGSGNAYLDNVLLEQMQCPLPHNISVTGITDHSAVIDWMAEGGETSWQVVVKPHELPLSQVAPVTVTSKPYYIDNLIFGKWYEVYVKADCGNGEYSSWSIPESFITDCASITTLPYVEDFENYFQPWYYNEFARPRCWTFPHTDWAYPDIFFPEYANSQQTHYYVGNSHSLWLRTDNSGEMLMAVMPKLDVELHDVRATFKMLAESGNSGHLEVGVLNSTADESSFELVRTIQAGEIVGGWTEEVVDFDLTAISGTGNHIAFRYYPWSTNWYMWMDDLEINYIHPTDTDSVGVSLYQLDDLVEVYPNPTSSEITVQYASSPIRDVEVSDMYGKLLARIPVNDYRVDMDLSSFASGVYFLRVTMEQGVVTKRVVKR